MGGQDENAVTTAHICGRGGCKRIDTALAAIIEKGEELWFCPEHMVDPFLKPGSSLPFSDEVYAAIDKQEFEEALRLRGLQKTTVISPETTKQSFQAVADPPDWQVIEVLEAHRWVSFRGCTCGWERRSDNWRTFHQHLGDVVGAIEWRESPPADKGV